MYIYERFKNLREKLTPHFGGFFELYLKKRQKVKPSVFLYFIN